MSDDWLDLHLSEARKMNRKQYYAARSWLRRVRYMLKLRYTGAYINPLKPNEFIIPAVELEKLNAKLIGEIKPLFIPLKAEYYDDFVGKRKLDEFRLYGPRWNFKTCYSGRQVILSRGYGKQNRLCGVIHEVVKIKLSSIGIRVQNSLRTIYGIKDGDDRDILIITPRDLLPMMPDTPF